MTVVRRPPRSGGGEAPTRPENRPDARRQRLTAAMMRVVGEKGYTAVSVADVVARAGVSRRTFYEHFADKEECFIAAYDDVFAFIFAAVLAAYDREHAWPDRIRAATAALLGGLGAEPKVARAGIVEVLAAGPRAVERRDAALRAFRTFFDPARPEVPDHQLPPIVAEATIGGIYEVMYRRLLTKGPDDLLALQRDIVELALAPFIGPEATRTD